MVACIDGDRGRFQRVTDRPFVIVSKGHIEIVGNGSYR
jgi:hypothetical protein